MGQDDSVLLIYNIVKEQLALQQAQKNSIETKASTLTAFAGGMLALLMGAWDTLIKFPVLSQEILLIGVALFLISIVIANIVTWIRKYRSDPNPEILAAEYLNKSTEETSLQIISNWIGTWKANNKTIEMIAIFLRITFLLQAIAFIALGIAFYISLLYGGR